MKGRCPIVVRLVANKWQWTASNVLKLVILGVLATLLTVACSSKTVSNLTTDSSNSAQCRTIEHEMGQIEVCGQPQTIAVLGPHMLDLLLSLDVQPSGYADPISFHPGKTFDNPALQIPYLGSRITTKPVNLGNSGSPSMETLTALNPDLIIGEIGGPNYDLLAQIAPTLFWKHIEDQELWQQSLREIAKALGREEKADRVVQSYQELVAAARMDFASVTASYPKLLLLSSNHIGQQIGVINQNAYVGQLLEEVGFQLVTLTPQNAQPFAPISIEALPQLDEADIIVVLGYKYDVDDEEQLTDRRSFEALVEAHQLRTVKQSWEKNEIAQSLTASRENRVFFATYYRWNALKGKIGAELTLEQLRQFLHL